MTFIYMWLLWLGVASFTWGAEAYDDGESKDGTEGLSPAERRAQLIAARRGVIPVVGEESSSIRSGSEFLRSEQGARTEEEEVSTAPSTNTTLVSAEKDLSPLSIAICNYEGPESIEKIIEALEVAKKAGTLNQQSQPSGRTALMDLVERVPEDVLLGTPGGGDPGLLQHFLDAGADPNMQDQNHDSCCLMALRARKYRVTEWLIQKVELLHTQLGKKLFVIACKAIDDIEDKDYQNFVRMLVNCDINFEMHRAEDIDIIKATASHLLKDFLLYSYFQNFCWDIETGIDKRIFSLTGFLCRESYNPFIAELYKKLAFGRYTYKASATEEDEEKKEYRVKLNHDGEYDSSTGFPTEVDSIPSLLMIASQLGDTENLQLELAKGIDPNSILLNGSTALTFAAANQNARCVEVLLAYGANPLLKNDNGLSALDISILEQDLESFWAIANSNLVKRADYENLLIKTIKANWPAGVAFLVFEKEVNPDTLLPQESEFDDAIPLLSYVCQDTELSRAPEMAETLLDAGADVNFPGTALHAVVQRAFYSKAEGKEVEDEETIIKLIDILVKYGANLSAQTDDEDSLTPLMLAATANLPNVCRKLLEAGAPVDDKNQMGYTALNFADPNDKEVDRKEVFRILAEGSENSCDLDKEENDSIDDIFIDEKEITDGERVKDVKLAQKAIPLPSSSSLFAIALKISEECYSRQAGGSHRRIMAFLAQLSHKEG